ncbi:unnamed protein product [Absidia cylindrospora]
MTHPPQEHRLLPMELLSLIVKYVDAGTLVTCTVVSSAFYEAVIRQLYRHIHLTCHSKGIGFLESLVSSPVGQHLRSVSLGGFLWTDKTLLLLMEKAPSLDAITIDDGRWVTDASMQQVSSFWPHLKSLYLSKSPITQLSFHVLGQQCHQLIHLTLDRCPFLQAHTFLVHFAGSQLQYLALAIAINEVDDGPLDHKEAWLMDDDATIDLTGLHALTKLHIHGPPFGIFHLAVIPGDCCWPRLTSIYMDECFDILDDDLIPLLRLVPGLTHLTLKDGEFSDAVLDAIATYNPNLVELDISYNDQFTAQGIRGLVRRCHQLVLVTLSYCHIILDEISDDRCSGSVVTFDNTYMALDHLDKYALDLLRRGGRDNGRQDKNDEH